ncbi:MAG: hypothetical protein N2044_08070 [Cyclobacteriaceae bacterium]|nr:hypothetical protein [Cyclobacteriaceae bacterium]
MKTYIADIIPKIQRFSQRLDDLTKLTNQHWVSLGDITQTKRVFIFRANNQLLISDNGIVEKGSWEYLGNQSLLLETKQESYLLKHGFFDENVIALKLDSTESYAFFVNETKYHSELNNITDILKFLENKYIKNNGSSSGLSSTQKRTINEDAKYGYDVKSEKEKYDFVWGNFIEYEIEFTCGRKGQVYKGGNTGKYFYMDITFGKKYYNNFEQAVYGLFLYLRQNNR